MLRSLSKFMGSLMVRFLGLSLIVILSPSWIPLLLLVIVGYTTGIVFLPTEWRFRRKMRSKGRCLSWEKLAALISPDDAGSLIVDSLTPGWNVHRVWWVPGDILSESPPRPPKMNIPHGAELTTKEWVDFFDYRFNLWCWEGYLNPEDGRAILIAGLRGRKQANSLADRFPGATVVHCSSWTRNCQVEKEGGNPTGDAEHPLWDHATDG